MAERVRVLSIDGGGIRGLVPALVLEELERRSGHPVADLFELLAGTSTGGILACALTAPGAGGGPARSAVELVELYEQEGPRIFSRSIWQRIRSADGWLDEKYAADALDSALRRYLGETRLSELLRDVVMPVYDTATRRPIFFKSRRARERPAAADVPARLAVRATCAAPTYFEPLPLGPSSLVDGGVLAVNPAMCAFAEVLRHSPEASVVLLSLGTGSAARPLPFDKVKDWGALEWARPILDVVFDGMGDVVDYQLRHAVGPERYWRLQAPLGEASDDLDDASPENLRRLRAVAERLIADRDAELDAICRVLTAPAPDPA